jgi:hypothetical protein
MCHCVYAVLGDIDKIQTKQTAWPLVRKRIIPTERPPLVGEILCQLLRIERSRVVSAADPPRSLISAFYAGAATSLSNSASFILTRLSGPHSRPIATQKIW